ncbi:MAG: heme ABC exporter ATP-binding protein CcmA [Alphaproteobacteria bacterium]|nr:heme ABC exporter ATP-binding protein CcmA [Alphaproteobacteria bacterium]MBU1514862.1 heme ABC exporter ATP-binding protein CcmA [Alphaproteobacteria bacterium]MBU2093783.1 heme ABC exporter ATP-binding protein CcmA [Alphaproteobacteria bacterium]MBU2149404.1 heme ABC exporter ATP-binding protein CcmA [Alphaproteobacteria bacterium]MBU2305364.1 heme ABC exporter ATP-binding protein CcmA [Alphaproteobacteria bacterium]
MITQLLLKDAAVRRGGRLLFEGVSLNLAAGEACALTGPNGSGKTSLLRAVAGLVRLEAGTIGFGDLDPADARGEGLHLVGHADGLKSARTAREELNFWSRWTGGAQASIQEAAEALDLVSLLDLEVRRLSAGQRRRLALARMLAAPRPLWLLDEPLSPLDAKWREGFSALMKRHLDGGGLILAAVHDPLPVATRSLELRQ